MPTFVALIVSLLLSMLSAVPAPAKQQQDDTPDEAPVVRRMTPELLWKLGRLGETAASTDGQRLVYTVRRFDLQADEGRTTLYLQDMLTGKQSEIIQDWKVINSLHWCRSPEGDRVFFVGMRGEAGEQAGTQNDGPEQSLQAWSLNPDNGDTVQLTNIEGGIANLKASPTGTHLAFTMDIKMDSEVKDLYPDLPKADARIIDSLMFRHWNAWHDFKYSHLHVAPLRDDGMVGEPIDLMAGIKADCPVPPFGGGEQFAWSPDGKEIAYTMKNVPDWATSTNSDVYLVAIDGQDQAKNISEGMAGYDNNPAYSPDGKYLAFHSMQRGGFEADRVRIMIVDRQTGEIRELTQGLDQTVHQATWTPDSQGLLFASEYRGTQQLFRIDLESAEARQVTQGRFNWDLIDVLPDGGTALVSKMDMLRPKELAVLNLTDSTDRVISTINDEIYEQLELPIIEERWVDATDGEKIHCWVIHPPDFDAASKRTWPMITYCQGGPQGQIGQWFSYRWNFHLMAAKGYVIVAPNRRGLPGFGRQWNDQISGDWGGQAMRDILSATDDMMKEPYIDKKHVAAIGASFGGYTVFWMMGNHNRRFCTMIAHCGVFNLESMYGSTEELFFVNWDLGGPYWESTDLQQKYDTFSPHRFVGNWDTPLLVVHGQKDFRVPVTQGMEAFTAAQVNGIPSRFLYYPEEGHWVLKPQNGVLWHRVFFDWLDRFCKPETRQQSSAATEEKTEVPTR